MIYFFIIRLLFLETFVLALPLQATRRAEEADPNASDGNPLIRHSQAPGPNSFPAAYGQIGQMTGQTTGFATQFPYTPPRPNSPQASPVTTGQTTGRGEVDLLSIPFRNLQIVPSSSNVDGLSDSFQSLEIGPVRTRTTRRHRGQPYAGTSRSRLPLQVDTILFSQAGAWSHPTRRKKCDKCTTWEIPCHIPAKPDETETEFIRPDSDYEKCINCRLPKECVRSLELAAKLVEKGRQARAHQ